MSVRARLLISPSFVDADAPRSNEEIARRDLLEHAACVSRALKILATSKKNIGTAPPYVAREAMPYGTSAACRPSGT